jgi:hypothetical protein
MYGVANRVDKGNECPVALADPRVSRYLGSVVCMMMYKEMTEANLLSSRVEASMFSMCGL